MKRLFLLAAVLLGACGPEYYPGILREPRVLASGDTLLRIEEPVYAAAGNLLYTHQWYCPTNAVVRSPSLHEGDGVHFEVHRCSGYIADLDTPKDGTTVKR